MINDLWYKNAVIYCLSVGTFMDANGDGIGDFQGLMRRLDYLHGLGVTAIWLMPFQPSPSRDDGYDVSDYYGVDPALRHARRFRRVHARRQAARHPRAHRPRRQPHLRSSIRGSRRRGAIRNSKYRDWYVWSKKKPPNANEGMVFPGVQKTTWTLRPGGARRGTSTASTTSSPTSTRRNPQVQAEILKIMGFWIQLGVSGFRMDAVPFVIAHQGRRGAASPSSSTTCCARFREFLQWRAGRLPSCSPRPTCCPRPTWSISATTATACT